MIEVDEQGAARAVHVTHARRLRDILELLAVTVVQQIAASVGPDQKGRIEVTVEVFDVKHLDKVMSSVKNVSGVLDVERLQGTA